MHYQLTDNYRLQNFMISNQNKSSAVIVRRPFLLAIQRLLCMVHIQRGNDYQCDVDGHTWVSVSARLL